MYSKFYNISVHAIRVYDSADNLYDLPHPVAEPPLYVAIDVRIEMLRTLLAALVQRSSLFLCRPIA